MTGAYITERQRVQEAEQELRRAHAQLEARVQERTAELAKVNETLRTKILEGQQAVEALARRTEELRAQQLAALNLAQDAEEARQLAEQSRAALARSNADLEQFAYVASHDLQEPLRMIASYLELLVKRYQGKLDAKADRWIGFAVDAADRMKQLINDLLEFSHVTIRGKPFARIDCVQAFNAALANLQQAIQESGAVVIHGTLPALQADATQLTQLFQNLIGNAIKYRRAQAPEVRVEAVRQGRHWQFSVRDNGIGIDPQFQQRIFMIFQRLHTRAEYPGTGIGLTLCKKIVERHGGRIWVESQPGLGATFFFTIPDRKEVPDGAGQAR